MSLTSQLSDIMGKYRDCPAITDQDGTRTLTYGELDGLSGRAASKLRDLGIREGGSVAVNMDRRTEYIAAELAILRIGAVVVPLIPDYPGDRVDYIRKDAGIKFIVEEDFFRNLPEEKDRAYPAWRDFPEDTKEFIFYTSGSTGKPKGIIYRDRAVVKGLLRNLEGGFLEVKPFIYAAPATMTFTASIVDYYRNFLLGGHVHMLSDEVRSDVEKMEDYYEKAGITAAFMPPRMLRLYRNRDRDLKLVFTASEKVSGVYSPDYRILNELGMTETLCSYCAFPIDREYENTPVGKPQGDVTIRLLDEDGNEVPPGEDGMIVPTGTFPFEYNNLPEESAKTFHPEPDGRVSIRTGDIGRILPDGNLLYVNRADWLMKIHGQRVEPGEIESAMRETPGVIDAVAKAFEQEDGSMLLCGFYTSSVPLDKEEIRASMSRKLPHYMVPSVLVRLERFPVNTNGKIDRKAIPCPDLTEQLQDYEKPVGPIEEAVARAMEKVLHLPKIGRNDNFLELGGNSMNAVVLAQACGIRGMTPQFIMLGKTLARIAELCSGQDRRPEIRDHVEKRTRYPISLSQNYQYDVCASLGKNMNLYDMIVYYELDSDTDTEILKNAIEETVRAFPVYRSRINMKEHWAEIDPSFEVRELTLCEEEFLSFRRSRLDEKRDFTGDPQKDAPLFDAAILCVDGKKLLFLDLCHIIYDGAGMKLFMDTVSAKTEGREGPVETFSLFDLASYEQSIRGTSFFKKAWAFYDAYYQGLDQKPGFFSEKTYDNPLIRRELLRGVRKRELDFFLKRMGVSILTLFQGALELTILKMTGKSDFAYMNVYDGRISAELENTQGVLAKAVFVRSSAEAGKPVKEYLAGIQVSYQNLVYHDVVDIPELIRKHPNIRSGFCLNFRTVPEPLSLNGKPLRVNEECWQELLEAHRPFTEFDLGIDNSRDGETHTAQVASTKASCAFVEEFLTVYDRTLRELMEEEWLSMEESQPHV